MLAPTSADAAKRLIRRYTVAGVILGMVFPLCAWTVDIATRQAGWTLTSLWRAHLINPLHWIIDLSPLALGILAHEVGKRRAMEIAVRETEARYRAEQQQVEAALRESEERFRQLAENIQQVFWLIEPRTNRILYVSPAYEALWGRTCESHYARPESFLEGIHPDDRERVVASLPKRALGAYAEEYRVVRPDGSWRWIRSRAFPIQDETGEVYRIAGISEDITERKQAEAALQDTNTKLRAGLAELERRSFEITSLGEMGELLHACQTTTEAYGVISHLIQQLFPGEVGRLYMISASRNVVETTAAWGSAPSDEAVFTPADCWALRRGHLHQVESDAAVPVCQHVPVPYPTAFVCVPLIAQGEALGLLHLRYTSPSLTPDSRPATHFTPAQVQLAQAAADSISLALANLRLRESLRNQSIRDPLTGLFNRRYMQESLEREIHRANRDQTPIGVVMIDLDHFKNFNDTFGHPAGDALLRELAHLLQSHVRGEDIACRYGGEEFALILPHTSLDVTWQRAELLREKFKNLQPLHDGQVLGSITLSVGVAVYPAHGADGEAVLQAADSALYRAKHSGRDRAVTAPLRSQA